MTMGAVVRHYSHPVAPSLQTLILGAPSAFSCRYVVPGGPVAPSPSPSTLPIPLHSPALFVSVVGGSRSPWKSEPRWRLSVNTFAAFTLWRKWGVGKKEEHCPFNVYGIPLHNAVVRLAAALSSAAFLVRSSR